MVSSVSASYNVLSLFQNGTSSQSTAGTETVEAIIENARQLKADASPARVQAASTITDTWIASSEETTSSSVSASSTEVTAETSSVDDSEKPSAIIDTFQALLSTVWVYNHLLTNKEGAKASLESYKSQLAAATDPKEQERLTKIVQGSERIAVQNAEAVIDMGKQIAAFRTGYDVSGNILERQDDGTYKIGTFVASVEGHTYFEHDGSGTAREYTWSGKVTDIYDLAKGTSESTGVGFWD